ncbi:MAG: peptidoglycan DD-metalloendopeptidase family protein [Candidatus Eisenbacteria bacterium]|nr:peptidoglycan DD-metalloendopeptidase family protein [Candidatus Eisenbacteria bacterium]
MRLLPVFLSFLHFVRRIRRSEIVRIVFLLVFLLGTIAPPIQTGKCSEKEIQTETKKAKKTTPTKKKRAPSKTPSKTTSKAPSKKTPSKTGSKTPAKTPSKTASKVPPKKTPQQEPVSEGDVEKQKGELEALRRELSKTRKEAAELAGKQRTAEKSLKIVETELSLTERLIQKLSRREEMLNAQLEKTREEISVALVEMENRRTILAWRVRGIYKYGEGKELEMLVSSRSLAELFKKYHYLMSVAQQDRVLLFQLKSKKEEIERKERKLDAAHREIVALQAEKEREKKNLETLRGQRKQALADIKAKRKESEKQIAKLENAQKKLQALIAELERKRREEIAKKLPPKKEWVASSVFAQNKGSLQWPTEGEVISRFGRSRHERFGTETFNNGIDIKAARGAPIKSVGKGRVEYVDWLSGYGKCVIINHGGGYYTFYAHGSEITVRPGDEVQAGQLIGKVGDTDSLSGDCLHFEIRRGKDSLDPQGWLR